MAQQQAGSPVDDPTAGSIGCCGVVVGMLGIVSLITALIALGFTLFTYPPDRWQGTADPNVHPLAIVVAPTHPQTVYIGTEQGSILISRDGGQSWREAHQGLPPATPISSLALLPGANQLLAGTSNGAYLSLDGGMTWRSAGSGIPPHTIVDAVAALPDGRLLAGVVGYGVYVLPVGSVTWAPAPTGLPRHSDVYAFLPLAQPGHVFAALISGGVYASQDGGLTWAESDRGLSAASGVNVFSLLAIPGQRGADDAILAGTSRGVFESSDLGKTWAPRSVGIGTTRVISLASDPLTPTNLFAGTDTGVFQSRDGGATWRAVGFGLPAGLHVGAVGIIHPAGGDQVILASVDRLYRYPGHWVLASEPWRALGFGVLALLALALLAILTWGVRAAVRS